MIVAVSRRKTRMMRTAKRRHVHLSHFMIRVSISFPFSENCWMQLKSADEVTKKSSIHPMTGMSGTRSVGRKSYTIAPISNMIDVICCLFISFFVCDAKVEAWLWWLVISYIFRCNANPVRNVLHE